MEEEEKALLAEQVVGPHRERILGLLQESPPRTVEAWAEVVHLAETFLQRRTLGAKGRPGKPGRASPPKIITRQRAAPAKAADGGETTRTLNHLRGQQRRMGDLAKKFRKLPRQDGQPRLQGDFGQATRVLTQEAKQVWAAFISKEQKRLGPESGE